MTDDEPEVGPGQAVLSWINLAMTFPSQHASEKCYEEIQSKLGGPGEDISCWRFASISAEKGVGVSDPDNLWRMVVITGDEAKMLRVQRIAAKWAAEPWDAPDDVIQSCTMRRLRLLIDAAQQGERVISQRKSYETGARISREGEVTPYNPKEKDD